MIPESHSPLNKNTVQVPILSTHVNTSLVQTVTVVQKLSPGE